MDLLLATEVGTACSPEGGQEMEDLLKGLAAALTAFCVRRTDEGNSARIEIMCLQSLQLIHIGG